MFDTDQNAIKMARHTAPGRVFFQCTSLARTGSIIKRLYLRKCCDTMGIVVG